MEAFNSEVLGMYEKTDWTASELANHVQNDHLMPPLCIQVFVHGGAAVDKDRAIIEYCNAQNLCTFQSIF